MELRLYCFNSFCVLEFAKFLSVTRVDGYEWDDDDWCFRSRNGVVLNAQGIREIDLNRGKVHFLTGHGGG